MCNQCGVQLEYQFEDTRDTFPDMTYVEVSEESARNYLRIVGYMIYEPDYEEM